MSLEEKEVPDITPEQAKKDEGYEDCELCTEGVREYIKEGFCVGADDEKACELDADHLVDKLMAGQISEQQFADGCVDLVEKHFGKAIAGEKDGEKKPTQQIHTE